MKRAALLISLFVIAVLCLTAAPAVGGPTPNPVCGACGSSFEDAASDNGVIVNVTASTAAIQIHPNGSATWTVTNRLSQSAATLSSSPETLTQITREAATSRGVIYRGDTGPVVFRSATVDNETVRIRFRDPDAGARHLGVLVVDYFHSPRMRGSWILNADPISVSGPTGTVVSNDPRGAINDEYAGDGELPTVTGNTVQWANTSTDGRQASLSEDLYLAFSEPATSSLQVAAAFTVASLPIWLGNISIVVLPAAFVYGILLIGVAAVARRAADSALAADRLAAAGVGFGVWLLGMVVFDALPATLGGVGTIYLIVGAAAWHRPDLLRSTRGALAVGLASMGGVAATLWGLGVVDARSALAPTVVHAMVTHLPLAVAPAFGHAVCRRGGSASNARIAAGFAGGIVAFLLAGGVFVPFDVGWFIFMTFGTVGAAVAAALFGLPLAMLGACQPTATTPHEGATPTSSEATETADGGDT
ncbi:hypothetical protein HKK80_02470 [Halonotius sp. F2-221B]|uniref:hypothetical protein n=1 Tax=Halonotius sp. F2-221B TaxID=2731620 RepID=UPI00398B356A